MSNKNLIIIAALGIGAYVYMRQQRQGGAAGGAVRPVVTNPQVGAPAAGATGGGGGLFDMVGALFAPLRNGFVGQQQPPTTQIANDDLPGQAGYGWKYYSDGISISPDGTYYKDGVVAWAPSNGDSVPINDPSAYWTPTPYEVTEGSMHNGRWYGF